VVVGLDCNAICAQNFESIDRLLDPSPYVGQGQLGEETEAAWMSRLDRATPQRHMVPEQSTIVGHNNP
jgi:hypothetical protein